jgi:bifunctional DNA-binding transcriptional regulator/antitoxin component of YhaV-PrlF toxin-antitoxin module
LPFSGFLIVNVSAVGGVAKIDFGYNVGSGVVWYDSVSIRPYAPVEKAYILAGPVTTPIGTVASLELVLCGYGVVPDYSGFGASSKHQQETTPKRAPVAGPGDVVLRVGGLAGHETHLGVVRLPLSVLERLGLKPGDFVEIIGATSTYAVAQPTEEEDIVKIDEVTRSNAGAELSDYMRIKKAVLPPAEKIVLRTNQPVTRVQIPAGAFPYAFDARLTRVRSGFELRRGRLSLFCMPKEVVVGGLAVSCLLVFYLVVSLISM